MKAVCELCGTIFEAGANGTRYCSRKCVGKASYIQRQRGRLEQCEVAEDLIKLANERLSVVSADEAVYLRRPDVKAIRVNANSRGWWPGKGFLARVRLVGTGPVTLNGRLWAEGR